jgi:hypothetical protein
MKNMNNIEIDKFIKELEPYKNTLVIHFFKVVRLVDVIETEQDYYWVFDSFEGIYHESCVGGWTPLKGFIDDKDYERMVKIWNRNNIEKVN